MRHRIINLVTNEVIQESPHSLIGVFMDRCRAQGAKGLWGDHYAQVKRPKDPRNVVAKCKHTKEVLIKL